MNGAEVRQSIWIDATPEVVWEFWTDAASMCQWWGVQAELDPRPNGLMRLTLAVGGVMAGRYVELDRPHRLVFRLGWEQTPGAPPVAPESSTVEVRLDPQDSGTLLTLTHVCLPDEESAAQHHEGWTHFLGALRQAACSRTKEEP